ncbi:hypothetical protein C8R45DRAFT_938107 [Mycena sanguinolenta]|nr:hypothetical protein C8R45DRAFT_938107 [Mycena sanguinolenta]
MKGWTVMMGATEPDLSKFGDLFPVIRDMNIDTPAHFEEVINGAQGAFNLGNLIVRPMDLFLPPAHPHVSDEAITVAATACCGIGCAPDRSAAQQKLVLLCLNTLSRMLACHGAMKNSLALGLLHAILYVATIFPDVRDSSETRGLKQMLSQTLPVSTVFQDVLEELAAQLPSVKSLAERPDFQRSWIHDDWLKFTAIAHDRIAYEAWMPLTSFSVRCDSRQGGFQTLFALSASLLLQLRLPEKRLESWWLQRSVPIDPNLCIYINLDSVLDNKNVGTRNLHFMRELLHRDLTEHRYSKNEPLIHSSRLPDFRDLVHTSHSDPFITVMNYSVTNNPVLCLQQISSMQSLPHAELVHWKEHIAQMSCSHGRMELHLMVIPEGFTFSESWGASNRYLMFPQRSERPALHDRLLQKGGSSVQEGDIQQLLVANDSVVKIH